MKTTELLNANFRDEEACYSTYRKWAENNCQHPQEVRVFDSVRGCFVLRTLPCGKCDHCRDVRFGDWYTRMYLHSREYNYVYYVTLTYACPEHATTKGVDYYGKFDPVSRIEKYIRPRCVGWEYGKALLDMHHRSGSVLIKNSHNSFNKPLTSLAFINPKHMQNFFKKLRIEVKDPRLSYYMCSEYGHHDGRPHSHAIIWTDKQLGLEDFRSAWSRDYVIVKGKLKPDRGHKNFELKFSCPFGHVVCEDISTCAKTNVPDSSGRNVFSYVCKYLGKMEYNNCQVLDYYRKQPAIDLSKIERKPIDKRIEHIHYEKYINDKDEVVIEPRKIIQGVNYCESEFIKAHGPFTRCSTVHSIGRDFAIANLERFAKGSFSLPKGPKGQSLILPSYFMFQTKSWLHQFRIKESSKGLPTVAFGDLPGRLDLLQQVVCWRDAYPTYEGNLFALSDAILSYLGRSPESIRRELTLYDTTNKVWYHPMPDAKYGLIFLIRKFDRTKRRYIDIGQMLPDELLRYLDDAFHRLKAFHDMLEQKSEENLRARSEFAANVYEAFGQDTLDKFHTRALEEMAAIRSSRQTRYELEHKFI